MDSKERVMVQEDVRVWRARDGTIPLLDDPTATTTAHKWDKPQMMNFESIMRRIHTGQVTDQDIRLSDMLIDWVCCTEKQLRKLAKPIISKGHLVGTRLRLLQKIGWFDGFVIENAAGDREHIWINGLAAAMYYAICEQLDDLPNPTQLMAVKDYVLSICAVNELRLLLEERGCRVEANYAPIWRRDEPPKPFARFVIETKRGKLTMFVERVRQKGKPLSLLRKKAAMYEEMTANAGGELPKEAGSDASMVVWSVGSMQAIEELVASIDYLPNSFVQAFLVDEGYPNFPYSFYIASKVGRMGDVHVQLLEMDVL